MVRWRRINLVAGLDAVGRFDVVFCRNVLATMDAPFQQKLLQDLTQVVADDGYLVLGAGESAEMAGGAFEAAPGHRAYWRRNPDASAVAA